MEIAFLKAAPGLHRWGALEFPQVGLMILECVRDLSRLQGDLAQQIVGGVQLQALVGVPGRGSHQRFQHVVRAPGVRQTGGQVASLPRDGAHSHRQLGQG